MKVGLIYYRYPLFDKGSYVQEYIDELANKSSGVVLISTHYPKSSFVKPKNLDIIWIKSPNIPIIGDLIFNILVLVKCFSSKFCDVDVVNSISARGALAGFLFCKLTHKPIFCTVEIINPPSGSFVDRVSYLLQKFVYSLPYNKIISWSKYYANQLVSFGIDKKKIVVIPGGINTHRFNPKISGKKIRSKFPKDCILIVFAKPLYEYNRKMVELLLESIKLIEKQVSIRLLIGRGEQKKRVDEKIKVLKLEKIVSYMPEVPITDIPKYYSAADIVVLPFTYAATVSRSLLEAMAMGKPIITSDSGEVADVVSHMENAYVVSPISQRIAEALVVLYKDKKLSIRLGNNALKEIRKKYSIEVIIKKTIELYSQSLI